MFQTKRTSVGPTRWIWRGATSTNFHADRRQKRSRRFDHPNSLNGLVPRWSTKQICSGHMSLAGPFGWRKALGPGGHTKPATSAFSPQFKTLTPKKRWRARTRTRGEGRCVCTARLHCQLARSVSSQDLSRAVMFAWHIELNIRLKISVLSIQYVVC